MTIMEETLEKENKRNACLTAIKINNLIVENMTSLKNAEPYYSWVEIKGLMEKIQDQFCKK